MLGFKEYLEEINGKGKLFAPPGLGDLGDNEFKGPLLPMDKNTKLLPDSFAKLITSVFFHWNEMGKILDLRRSIVIGIALSETNQKESDVLNVLEPCSRDLRFPPKVFVPPQVQQWFQELMKTRKRLVDQLPDDALSKPFVPSVYNLIWTITGGKGGTEWNEPTMKKEKK